MKYLKLNLTKTKPMIKLMQLMAKIYTFICDSLFCFGNNNIQIMFQRKYRIRINYKLLLLSYRFF